MTRATFIIVALLAGCTPDARDIALADVDLSNMQTVADIRAQLLPQEQVPFANYVVRHHNMSANFCGKPLVAATGKEPATIGEAVDLSIIRDAAERQALIEAKKPKTASQLARSEWRNLVSAKDMLLDSQTRLRMDFGDKAVQRPEWRSLESKITEIDKELVAMRPTVFGSGPY